MQTLIFLNGKLPGRRVIEYLTSRKTFIIAADGGANSLRKYGITPDVIIGDFDSVSRQTLKFYSEKKVEIKKISEQDTTDFEKSLRYCVRKRLKNITVVGGTSMRPDHTLNNYSVLKKFSGRLNIRMLTDEYEIFFVRKNVRFSYKTDSPVSLLALPKAEKITTKGLKYTLKNSDLEFGIRDGTLNESVSELISISFAKGSLLLFKKHFIDRN